MNWLFNLFADKTFGAKRSFEWSSFRKQHIMNKCEYCNSKWFLNLHHVLPFHLYKELELEPTNICTLCRSCHLLLGHFQKWASFNEDIKSWITLRQNRP